LRLLFHVGEVASGDKMGLVAVRVLPFWLPAIPIRNRPATEDIDNGAANGREVFGAVVGSPNNTSEVGKLGMPGNERVLGRGDTIPNRREP
jgi:hypothetical protein